MPFANYIDKKLKQKIDKSTIISFDVFDTLLLRRCAFPTDVFLITYNKLDDPVKNYIGIEELSLLRQKVEVDARHKISKKGYEDVTLKEIYQEFRDVLEKEYKIDKDIADNFVRKAYQEELKTEESLLYPNYLIYPILRYVQEKKKKIVLLSDMYLPQKFIEKQIKKHLPLKTFELFVSSETRVLKTTGKAYHMLSKKYKQPPSNFLHIGDNLKADIKQARRQGFQSYFLPKPIEVITRKIQPYKKQYLELKSTPSNTLTYILQSITLGINIESLIRYLTNQIDLGTFLGETLTGPLALDYTLWVIKNAKEDISKHPKTAILWLSRDGYIPFKIATFLQNLDNNPDLTIDNIYLFASRRAIVFPVTAEVKEEFLKQAVFSKPGLQVRDHLERLKIKIPKKLLRSALSGINTSLNTKIITAKDFDKLKKLFSLLHPYYLKKAKTEKQVYLKYLINQKIFSYDRLFIVDLGWYGTVIKALEKMINPYPGGGILTIPILMMTKSLKKLYKDFSYSQFKPKVYGNNLLKKRTIRRLIESSVDILENLFPAPHDTVIRIKPTGTPLYGNVEPQWKKEEQEKIIQGALQSARLMVSIIKKLSLESYEPSPLFYFQPLLFILKKTPKEITCYLGDFPIQVGWGNYREKHYIAKPPTTLNPFTLHSHYKMTLWKTGFISRLSLLQKISLIIGKLIIPPSNAVLYCKTYITQIYHRITTGAKKLVFSIVKFLLLKRYSYKISKTPYE